MHPLNPLFLHVPHASTLIPEEALVDFLVGPAALKQELLRVTDWFTDELYADGCDSAQVVQAGVSRLVVDVERFAEEAQEPCSAVGMGATYVKTCDGRDLRRLTPARRMELLAHHYWPHHQRLNQAAEARVASFGRCVLLDAHSFPVVPLPTQSDVRSPPEIGIGTDAAHTSPELHTLAEEFFRERGFSVGVNHPFSGTMVPNAFFARDTRVQSIMIEVRRDLYVDEAAGERNAGFARVRSVLTELRGVLEQFSRDGRCDAWGT